MEGRGFHVVGALLLLSYGLFVVVVHSQEYNQNPTLPTRGGDGAAPSTVLAGEAASQPSCSCHDMKEKIATCQSSLSELETKNAATLGAEKEQTKICQDSLGKLEAQTAALGAAKEQLQHRITELQSKVDGCSSASSESQARLEEQVTQCRAEFANERELRQRETNELRAGLETAGGKENEFQAKLVESEARHKEIFQQVESLQAKLEAARRKEHELEAKLGESEVLQKELPQQVEAFQAEIEAGRIKERDLEEKLGESEAKQKELSEHVASFQARLGEADAKQKEVSGRVESLQLELSEGRKRESELKHNHESQLQKTRDQIVQQSENECKQRLVRRDAMQQKLMVENAQLRETARAEKTSAQTLQKDLLELRMELFKINERIRESRKTRDAVVKFWKTWSTWLTEQVVQHPQYPAAAKFCGDAIRSCDRTWQQVWHQIKTISRKLDHEASLLVPESISRSPEWASLKRCWCDSAETMTTLVQLMSAPAVLVHGAKFVHTHCTHFLIYGSAVLVLAILLCFLARTRPSTRSSKMKDEKEKIS